MARKPARQAATQTATKSKGLTGKNKLQRTATRKAKRKLPVDSAPDDDGPAVASVLIDNSRPFESLDPKLLALVDSCQWVCWYTVSHPGDGILRDSVEKFCRRLNDAEQEFGLWSAAVDEGLRAIHAPNPAEWSQIFGGSYCDVALDLGRRIWLAMSVAADPQQATAVRPGRRPELDTDKLVARWKAPSLKVALRAYAVANFGELKARISGELLELRNEIEAEQIPLQELLRVPSPFAIRNVGDLVNASDCLKEISRQSDPASWRANTLSPKALPDPEQLRPLDRLLTYLQSEAKDPSDLAGTLSQLVARVAVNRNVERAEILKMPLAEFLAAIERGEPPQRTNWTGPTTKGDIARELDCHRNTVSNWIKIGLLACRSIPGSSLIQVDSDKLASLKGDRKK